MDENEGPAPARPAQLVPRPDEPADGDDPQGRALLYGSAALIVVVLVAVGIVVSTRFGDEPVSEGQEGGRLYAVDDDFGRGNSASLGSTGGRPWEDVTGSFAVKDGEAVVDEVNEEGPRTITVTELSATNGSISVTAGTMVQGWGVVFRYVGPFNYWYVQAVPDYSVFNVVKVVNGTYTVVGRSAPTRVVDGMSVEVRLANAAIEIRVDGEPVFGLVSRHALGATKAGLIAVGSDAGDASWASFGAIPDRAQPGPTKPVVAGDATTTSDGSGTTATSTTDAATTSSTSRASTSSTTGATASPDG